MKSTSTSTGGVEYIEGITALQGIHEGKICAIIGTGTSMESMDLSSLDEYDVTINLNEAVKFYISTYMMIMDERAIAKTMEHLKNQNVAVLSEPCIDVLKNRPPFSKDGIAADEKFAQLRAIHSFRTSKSNTGGSLCCGGGALSAGLSLALWMGASEAHLYGCDFYRYKDKSYAYDLNTAPESQMIQVNYDKNPPRFITSSMKSLVDGITVNAEFWSERMRVINKNPLSELRCFEGGRREEW